MTFQTGGSEVTFTSIQPSWYNTTGTAITGGQFTNTTTFSREARDYRLQPKMSIPKTTGEINIPSNPQVMKPEDTMKDKEKGNEDGKKKLRKNGKSQITQEVSQKTQGSSRLRGVLHNLD